MGDIRRSGQFTNLKDLTIGDPYWLVKLSKGNQYAKKLWEGWVLFSGTEMDGRYGFVNSHRSVMILRKEDYEARWVLFQEKEEAA